MEIFGLVTVRGVPSMANFRRVSKVVEEAPERPALPKDIFDVCKLEAHAFIGLKNIRGQEQILHQGNKGANTHA